jgi:hypothetical protein
MERGFRGEENKKSYPKLRLYRSGYGDFGIDASMGM